MQDNHPLLEAVKTIRDQSVEELEATINALGVFRDHRFNYGNVHIRNQYGFYQIPRQLAMLLIDLKEYRIRNMVNIGSFNGWTAAFVSRYLDVPCLSIDTRPENLDPGLKNCGVEFVTGTSDDLAGRSFDLCFIDGSHMMKWLRKDFENLGQHSRYCVFHDINDALCPDVVQFYNEIAPSYWHKEYTYHSNNERVMGIGLLRIQTVYL